ncbi:uncharacterized protein LOC124887695 [Capsicum annuum]|uniref:uncharacterized protein LOC124887695 n=1 Tax=Capsicum annuum TaxID=4072 RepID=UPI001FB146D6|nr:uncharacterized protein LOC124887695 [Capsicum annuum]
MDELRQAQIEKVQEALDMGEVEIGKGLNQELDFARAANTRWGSHYKSFKKFISMFDFIIDVLDTIVVDSKSDEEKARATGYLRTCQHLRVAEYTISHHYRVEVFFKIIDWKLQELNDHRFNEVIIDLLIGVACLNPVDSFSSFDINKILRMTKLYLDDFDENIMVTLRILLDTYIVDVRHVDGRFSNLKGLGDLSEELVKTKKHFNYSVVFRLIKFALLLLVSTATVERAFR